MLRILLSLLLALLPAGACIWDRDTLREEARGKLDSVQAIIGRFDRYPAQYYEMRLARVTEELKAKPDALDLYDDAGVACSRLEHHDEAIAWMEKKKAVLDSKLADETKEERYRYLSNIGTFYLIRWISRPEETRASDLSDLHASEGFIASALQLNPDAHFGREKFQLKLIEWLLGKSPRSQEGQLSANFLYPPRERVSKDFSPEEARKGITGLIQLGAAWESVDSFHALAPALRSRGSHQLAFLAGLRHKELLDKGNASFHPDPEIRRLVQPILLLDSASAKAATGYFQKAREAVRNRDTAWLAYQKERFAQGLHPDTHPGFWKDWKEPKIPKMPGPTVGEHLRRHGLYWLIGLVVLAYLWQFVPKRASRRSKEIASSAVA